MAMDIIARGMAAKANKELETKADIVNGKVPAEQLPSYVDDVIEYEDLSHFPEEGEEGKIYVALDTGFTYRWGGSEYVQIGGQDLSNFATKDEAFNVVNASDIASNGVLTPEQLTMFTNGKPTRLIGTLTLGGQTINNGIISPAFEWSQNSYICSYIGPQALTYNCIASLSIDNGTLSIVIDMSFNVQWLNTTRPFYDATVQHELRVNGSITDGTNSVTVANIANGTFDVINASDIASDNFLTQAQYDLITNGKLTKINGGAFLQVYDGILTPTRKYGDNRDYGFVIGNDSNGNGRIQRFRIDTNKKIYIISLYSYIGFDMSGNLTLNTRNISYYLNNVYPYATNSTTTLQYETINEISISADTTFTLAAAPSDTYPEYKANLTNTDTSNAITITLTGVSKIKTNDSNITFVEGTDSTFTIPANASVELNIQNGKAIVFNWDAGSIEFTPTEVGANE